MSQSYVPEYAPFVVLAFLATLGVTGLLAVAAAATLLLRRRRFAKWLALGGIAIGLAYAAVLFAVAVRSDEKVLRPGDRKYFCEIDCHLAYSIESATASADRLTIALRTWFDPNTIASFRGNAPLMPNRRIAYLEDGSRQRVSPSRFGGTPLTTSLRPGESYTTRLVFELPPGFRATRFFLGNPPGVENLLVGHENSPAHPRIYFAIE